MKTYLKRFLMIALIVGLSLSFAGIPLYAAEPQTFDTIPDIEAPPYSSHFYPQTLLAWDFDTDPDAIHNVSRTPLVPRITGAKTNPNQSLEAKVYALAIANQHTSGTPSQGGTEKAIYNFTNWQYIDVLVAWAGSAGEGIIVPPSSDLTDIAHRNGVPVLGTVFFPPSAYGGRSEWVTEFTQKRADGSFPVADKLLELADYYGFDGWFINEETNVSAKDAGALKEMLEYLQAHKPEDMEIMWYDSMLKSGGVSWQNELNDNNKIFFQDGNKRVSDSMFLNFWWNQTMNKRSANKAKELKRNPFDVAAGIDVQGVGINTSYRLSSLADEKGAFMSLGLYGADWSLRDGANYNIDKYWENELQFWTNPSGDPRNTSASNQSWQGISRYFVEKSPLTRLPFSTSFNAGHGDHYYQKGQLALEGTFNNRSTQDIMPTYKWVVDQKDNTLKPFIDYDTVYNGGTSLGLKGNVKQGQATFIKLFKSDFLLAGDEQVVLKFQGPVIPQLTMTFKDTNNTPVTIHGTVETGTWHTITYDVSLFQGRTLTTFGLTLEAQETVNDTTINLGYLAIQGSNTATVNPITDAKILGKHVVDNVIADFRIGWQSDMKDIKQFNIYRLSASGERNFVGSTATTAYFLRNQKRDATEIHYEIIPVDIFDVEHPEQAGTLRYSFASLPLPTGDFKPSKSLVAVDESVTFISMASASTQKVHWILEGAVDDKLTGAEVTTSFALPGVYTVTMILENSSGQVEVMKENVVTVYGTDFTDVETNLALNVTDVKTSGYCNPRETPQQAFDGKLNTKWCDNGHDEPWLMLDLGSLATLTGFRLHHAGAGGESKEWNSKDYEILVSSDQTTWTKVVHNKNNILDVSEESIPLTEARYVKLILNRAEQAGRTARIYEFAVLGITGTDIQVHPNQLALSQLRHLYYTTDVKEDVYTEASYATLNAMRQEVKKVLDLNHSDTERIATLKEGLESAFENLEPLT